MNDAESEREPRMDLVVVPQRETVMRYECHLRALYGGDSSAADERVLISVAARDAPLRRYKAVQSQLVTIRSLAAGLENSGWVGRICRPRVGPVLSIDGGRQSEVATDIPL